METSALSTRSVSRPTTGAFRLAAPLAFAALTLASALSAQAPKSPAAKPLTPPPPAPSLADLANPPATATKLPTGISTVQLRAGTGKVSPRVQDWIAFFAIGRRSDGAVVQNTYTSAEPIRMQVSRLFPAWQTAFGGMVAGEQRRFWFPAELAPKNPKTGAQEAIVFDLELVAVFRTTDPPKSIRQHDPKATQAGLGAWTLTVKPGKGGPAATRQDAALLNFTVWNDAGIPQSTSALEGRPTLFPLDRVMSAFADCVVGMTVGEVRHCWVSAAFNEGFPGAPKGALVFELELLNLADAAKIFSSGTPKPN